MTDLTIPLLSNQVTQFPRDPQGDEFARCISQITLEWGGIEYLLYCILQAIDYKKASDWTTKLFAPRSLKARKKIVLDQVSAAVRISYPQYIDLLVAQLDQLQTIQDRRNLLAHGLWLHGPSDHAFRVQPLNINTATKIVERATEIDMDYLVNLIEDIEGLKQGVSGLVAEMLAHQQLKKWGRR